MLKVAKAIGLVIGIWPLAVMGAAMNCPSVVTIRVDNKNEVDVTVRSAATPTYEIGLLLKCKNLKDNYVTRYENIQLKSETYLYTGQTKSYKFAIPDGARPETCEAFVEDCKITTDIQSNGLIDIEGGSQH